MGNQVTVWFAHIENQWRINGVRLVLISAVAGVLVIDDWATAWVPDSKPVSCNRSSLTPLFFVVYGLTEEAVYPVD